MSILMIGKISMKQHYLKKKNFIVTWISKTLQMQIICIEEEFVKKNFREACLKIYQLDLAKFLLAPGLAWQEALKMQK